MLELFRKNHFFNSLLLLLYALLLRLPIQFADSQQPLESRGLITQWIFGAFDGQSLTTQLIAVLLIFLHAVLINRLVIRHRLTDEMTLFPGLFYILLMSFFPGMIGLNAALIGNTFLLLALPELFISHKKIMAASRIFNAGFWLSMAALAYFGYIAFFLFGLVGLSIQRTVRSKEWLQYIVGYITPLLIALMLDYLIESDTLSFTSHFSNAVFFSFSGGISLKPILQLIFFGSLILFTLLNYNGFTVRKSIHAQKKIDILYWFMLFSGLSVCIQSSVDSRDWAVVVVPLGIFTGMLFSQWKINWFAEALHFILLMACLALQFWSLL